MIRTRHILDPITATTTAKTNTTTTLQTMTTKALLALELLVFSWMILAYGQDLMPEGPRRRGNREILTIRRVKAQEIKQVDLCPASLADHVPQEVVKTLSGDHNDESDSGSDATSSTLTEIGLHRNGDPDACGHAPISMEALEKAMQAFPAKSKGCPDPVSTEGEPELDKYQVEALLTEFFHQQFDVDSVDSSSDKASSNGQCASTDRVQNKEVSGFLGFCDMGRDRTVPQPDSAQLVEVPSGSLPCRFFTREGVRIASLSQLADLVTKVKSYPAPSEKCQNAGDESDETCVASSNQLDLYAVPAGRVFMFAPKYVGEVFELPHVLDKSGNALSVKVLSLDPRVFDIFNFFSVAEAQQLIDKAVQETSETHKLHRSTTGTIGASVFDRRTSENAWDTHGKLAQTIKRRCMSALGFDEYYESHTDGLQILRYNLTTAYVPHMDYLTDVPKEDYDYRSGGRGGNRFATILLYMSDLEENAGGETVFSRGDRPEPVNKTSPELLQELRASGEIDSLKAGSWEERMTLQCRTKLSVTPKKARAVLFYSQFPNGTLDKKSEHGGCPVLHGQKWAANLWAWNAAREAFAHAPLKFGHAAEERKAKSDSSHSAVSALFFNSGKDKRFQNARLYYHDSYWGELGAGESIRINTYVSHVWNVKDENGKLLHTWTINQASSEEQHFTL